MKRDIVDQLLDQWSEERPNMDASSLGVVVRVQMLSKLLLQCSTEALDAHDLKPWEYDVLSALRRQGAPYALPATELANAALLTSGAMTTRIDRLTERNFVRRRANKNDRRSVLVQLTASGRRLVDTAIKSRLDTADRVLGGFSTTEKRELAGSLRNLMLGIDAAGATA